MTVWDLMEVAERVFNTRRKERIELGRKIRNYKKKFDRRLESTSVRKTGRTKGNS